MEFLATVKNSLVHDNNLPYLSPSVREWGSVLSHFHKGLYWPLRYRKYTSYNAKIASNPVGSINYFRWSYILRCLNSISSEPLQVLAEVFLVSTSLRCLVSWMWVIRFYLWIIVLKNHCYDRMNPTWKNSTLCVYHLSFPSSITASQWPPFITSPTPQHKEGSWQLCQQDP